MLIKRSQKNQIAIPKAVLESAGLGKGDVYFDVVYKSGHIILTPMQVEEKIPHELLKRFEDNNLRTGPGDKTYSSMSEATKGLHRGNHH